MKILKKAGERAFSLIEIMIAMVLMTFIVIGLLAMFQQVQKAFRSSMTQVDVLEAGRSTVDLLAHEMEQMIASSIPYANGGRYGSTNFFAWVSPDFSTPLLQELAGSTTPRTNVVQTMFFMRKENQSWIGTGYQVRPDYANAGLGTLYRFTTNVSKLRAIGLSEEFLRALPPIGQPATNNFSRVADGVVSFRVRAYDLHGVTLGNVGTNLAYQNVPQFVSIPNTVGQYNSLNQQYNYTFMSNALPAALELEIGFLEPHLVDRYRSLAQPAQLQFLTNHAANVHLFRQRIPIRNVELSVYQ